MDKHKKTLNGDVDLNAADGSGGDGGGKQSGCEGQSPVGQQGNSRSSERRKTDRRKDLQGAGHDKSAGGKLAAELNEAVNCKNEEISKLCGELESLKDIMKRRQADFENYKKRAQKSQEDFRKYAIKDLALDIIIIHDDLIRAIEASESKDEQGQLQEAHRSFIDGVAMISNTILETLKRYSITEISSINEEFNPNFHEAVEIEMSPEVERDTVVRVYQKGFKLDDVVIRSSKVKVAKPAKMADAQQENEQDN